MKRKALWAGLLAGVGLLALVSVGAALGHPVWGGEPGEFHPWWYSNETAPMPPWWYNWSTPWRGEPYEGEGEGWFCPGPIWGYGWGGLPRGFPGGGPRGCWGGGWGAQGSRWGGPPRRGFGMGRWTG